MMSPEARLTYEIHDTRRNALACRRIVLRDTVEIAQARLDAIYGAGRMILRERGDVS